MATSNTLTHLLDTNTVPSNVEAASIEQSIAKYDIEIATCEIEIAKLRSQLDALVEQRRRHNAVLSHLRRMPLELLGEIFAMVPLYILDQRGRQDVINLGLVCKRWRDATIYTHRLWSSVALSPHDGLKAYDKTVSWFEKSGGVPKSLEFSAWMHCKCSDGGDYRCLATNPALTRLLTEGPVLDHFTLVVSSTACFKNWIAAIDAAEKVPGKPRPWDALRSFDLTFNEDGEDRWGELEYDIPEQWCFSLLPPAITALHLYLPAAWAGFDEDDESLSRHGALKIPVEVLNRLITFTIKCDWSGTKLVELLHHCTNVETLTIKFNNRSPLLEERDNPLLHTLAKSRILLPKVRSLRLREAGTAEILRYLSTPAITNLDLGFADWEAEDDDFVDIVPKFLHASDATTSLLSLRIYNLHIAGYDLRQSLDGLDSLKRLTLDKVTWSGLRLFIAVKNSDHKCKPRIPSVEQLEILQFPDDRGVLPIGALMEGIRQGCMPCTLTMSFRGAHSKTRPFFTEESRRAWRDKAFMYVQTVPPFDWECLQV